LLLATAVAVAAPIPAAAQDAPLLLQRWVGTHQNRPLFLDFYGDTMLVVDDLYVTDFVATGDSLRVFGDTSFTAHYRFAADREVIRLLLRTADGAVITMSHQGPLARPLKGNWVGAPSRFADRQMLLWMSVTGVARWRWASQGQWTDGEWDRNHRMIEFTWLPDSTIWQSMYDPLAGQLLFDETVPESGVTVLRRFFRRP
jgi:hypothetical protein